MNTIKFRDLNIANQESIDNPKSETRDHEADCIQSAVIGDDVAFNEELKSVVDHGIRDIEDRAHRYAGNSEAQRAGFVAEADHCATFNVRSKLDRSRNHAVLEQTNNKGGDFRIMNGKKVLLEGEVKYYGDAKGTENALRGYGDKQRVAPADQVEEIADIARKRALREAAKDNPVRKAVGRQHQEVADNVKKRITDGKRSSTPRTYKENRNIAKKAGEGKLKAADVMPDMTETRSRRRGGSGVAEGYSYAG